jgi:argininosuccinate lyase
VKLASDGKVGLEKLTLAQMRSVEPQITEAVFEVLGVEKSVRSRTSYGGAAPANVRAQARRWLGKLGKEAAKVV